MPGNCSLTAETSFRGNVFSIAERARRIVLSNKSLRPAVSLVRFNQSHRERVIYQASHPYYSQYLYRKYDLK